MLFTGLGDWLGLEALLALPLPVPDPLGLPLFLPVPLADPGGWVGEMSQARSMPGLVTSE